MREQLPALLHRIERATPAPLRRLLKRVAPSLVAGAHGLVLSAAPPEPTEATIADGPLRGRRFVCRLRYEADYIFGTHEPGVTAWLIEHVRPSTIVFDIGAHAGYTTLVMAALVGPSGLVVAFEPNRQNRDLITRNLAINTDLTRQVRLETCAVSDTYGAAFFGGDDTTGHLAERGEPVTTTSVDAYVSGSGRVPSLIKLDIEGGETRAFDGMDTVLRASHPTLIVEIHDAAAYDRFSRLLDEYGYRTWTEDAQAATITPGRWNGKRALYLAR